MEVVGELREACGTVGVESLERQPDLAVQGHPPRPGQLLVHGLADERVGERVAAHRTRVLDDDARPDRLLEILEQSIARCDRERLEHVQVEGATDHRGGPEHAVRAVAQARQPLADHLGEPLRHAQLLE